MLKMTGGGTLYPLAFKSYHVSLQDFSSLPGTSSCSRNWRNRASVCPSLLSTAILH